MLLFLKELLIYLINNNCLIKLFALIRIDLHFKFVTKLIKFDKKEISYLIKGKTYKQSQLLSMYTQDQINQALKAGTVKIKK